MRFIRSLFIFGLASVMLYSPVSGQQQNGSITGLVQDTVGAVLVGASVTIVAPDNRERTTTSNARGEFSVTGLAPGVYTVKVFSANFGLYENTEVTVTAGQRTELIVPLAPEGVTEQVDIDTEQGVTTDPQGNLGATVLKDGDLDALPDDPDELEAALQALAGPSAGPNGGQIYIDGFEGGRLPPKEAIREIRINQNPFSAEYDRLGFGRVEILTRPGSDQFRGSAFTNFNDARFNSRNPFAENRAPGQTLFFGGNISGPVQKGKSSFFLDINNRNIDSNTILNAIVLDQNLNEVPIQQEIPVPTRRFSISPRFDYAINENNTFIARYSFTRATNENQGIGGISLPSRATASTFTEHEIRLTETMIINPKTINETRFEYEVGDREQVGDNTLPGISVGSAFSGGGSSIGQNLNRTREWELQNYTTTSLGRNSQHAIKFGGRVGHTSITDRSDSNFGGSFTFLNLDSYRNTILNTSIPQQYSVTIGTPEQKVSRTVYSLFVTDDWRINPGLTISFGLRYENQTNINDNANFAPRFSFAWSPGAGGARPPKTVFRGGFGVFYDRFSENLTLQAQRFNGTNQLNLIVNASDPDPIRRAAAIALLSQVVFTNDNVSNVPTSEQILAVLPQSNTIRSIDTELKSPRTYQVAVGMERQLPMRTTLSLFYIGARTDNVLRSRNINAPICPDQIGCLNAPRPDPTGGNVYQYESTGRSTQNQMIINFRSNFNPRVSLWGNYRLGYAKSDSDGSGSFPSYSYDLSDEYGRSSFDTRHNIVMGGNITLPWQISMSPFINFNSGRPFNFTRGQDLNGDSIFNERPTFGELGARCTELGLNNSFCDIAGQDTNSIIPRNFGNGPKFFAVNMRFSKNFGFGSSPEPAASTTGGGAPGAGGIPVGRGGRGGGGGRGGMGGFGGGERKPYNLNIGLNVNNIFNTVNFNPPVSNLASNRFGQYTSTAGGWGGWGGGGGGSSANRSVTLQARFSW